MILSAWRIVSKEHLASAFSGEGAKRYPGRWNSVDVSVVYTAGSISLALLELLVHLREATTLPDYRLIEVQFDDSIVEAVKTDGLPSNWQDDPAPLSLRRLGDEWIHSQRSAVFQVPSAITGEPNYLLNPAHPRFADIQIGKPGVFEIDTRLRAASPVPKIKRKRKR